MAESLPTQIVPYSTPDLDTILLWRWPETNGLPVCPKCNCKKCWRTETKQRPDRFKCKSCKHRFSVLSGSIFNSSNLSYAAIARAIELSRKDKQFTLKQIANIVKVDYRTACIIRKKLQMRTVRKVKEKQIITEPILDVERVHISICKKPFQSIFAGRAALAPPPAKSRTVVDLDEMRSKGWQSLVGNSFQN